MPRVLLAQGFVGERQTEQRRELAASVPGHLPMAEQLFSKLDHDKDPSAFVVRQQRSSRSTQTIGLQ